MKKKIFTKDNLIFFLILNLGLIFTAVGISIFKTPNHFAFGGTSGLSIILSTLFPKWNVGAFMWIVNAALVVLGFFFLGIRSMGWTIYSSFALSFYVSACEVIYPLSFPLTHDVFLELCFAVILPAVGAAMVFNVGASTGGTDCSHDPAQIYQSGDWTRPSGQRSWNRTDRRLPLRCTDRTLLYPGNDLEMYRCRQCH